MITHPIEWLEQIDSTNSELLRRVAVGAVRAPHTLVAAQQTQGRGRAGRAWLSGAENLCLSMLIELPLPVAAIPPLTLALGVAARRALLHACPRLGRLKMQLKWPNDLYLNGVKLGGILLEVAKNSPEISLAERRHGKTSLAERRHGKTSLAERRHGKTPLAERRHGKTSLAEPVTQQTNMLPKTLVVAGIGVNLRLAQGLDISQEYTDLACHGIDLTARELAPRMEAAWTAAAADFALSGLRDFMCEWQAADLLFGQQLILSDGTSAAPEVGWVGAGIRANGALIVQCDDQIRELFAGEIRVRKQ
jgi:biotin-(acetyl-CoA carboxylase) ligase